MDGGMAEAHYQLGLVYAKRQEWPQAAAEFDRVTGSFRRMRTPTTTAG